MNELKKKKKKKRESPIKIHRDKMGGMYIINT